MQPKPRPDVRQSERAMSVLAISLAIGCLVIPFYAAQAASLGQFVAIFGVALVIACSALLVGGLLGFLFGIPRTLQRDAGPIPPPEGKAAPAAGDDRSAPSYAPNTNLEQISDWLTKILVGVGLTQLTNLPAALSDYAGYVSAGLGNYPSSGIFSISLLLFYLISGFLLSYLWTRLHLAGALKEADASSRLVAVETKLDIIDIDAKAWSLTQRLLNPSPGSTPPSQEEINNIIAPASGTMKAQMFWAAAQVRSDNWANLAGKPKMERTIPIFRALIASDTEGVYHANHGQLGYALKDQRKPDYVEALAELSEAIRLRGNWQKSGWLPYYEFASAICRIHLDPAFGSGKRSDNATRTAILSDLQVAFSAIETEEKARADPDIKKWMQLNGSPTGIKVMRRAYS